MSGTFELAFIKPPNSPAVLTQDAPHPFDLLHGTDTGGYVSSGSLEAVSLSAFFATGYLGVPPSVLRPVLQSLPIKFEEFTFVDVGCGKGRALFIAAEFPFRHLVGVEIAREPFEAALSNVSLNPAWQERIAVFNEDATTFQYPNEQLVLYFYDPFYKPALRRALANLERQLRASPRTVYLIHGELHSKDQADLKGTESSIFREAISSYPFIQHISDNAYQISEADAAAEPSGCDEVRFTICVATLSN